MADPEASTEVPAESLAQGAYSRAPGTRDFPPEAAARRDRIETRLLERFSAYGFSRVDVPTLEYRDLYSPARIGPELFHHLVLARLPAANTFPPEVEPAPGEPNNRLTTQDAALRPDFTGPLARMMVTRLLDDYGIADELPTRWSYAGSVFRARTPRPLRLIEFRQAGVELVGASHPMADLEVLSLACDAAEDLQVPDWQLHLGHAGLFRSLIALACPQNPLARAALSSGLMQASRMRNRVRLGDDGFQSYLHESRASLEQRVRDWLSEPGETSHSDRITEHMQRNWFALLSPESHDLHQWRTLLPNLHERHLSESWSRTYGIADAHREALLSLARAGGDPADFFEAVGRYIEELAPHASAEQLERVERQLGSFHELTGELRAAIGGPLDLVVTAAASRGIGYYTGITFELHTAATRTAESAVCGGGRYRGLHQWLYNRAAQTAALRGEASLPPLPHSDVASNLTGVGFAFGIDRLDAALRKQRPFRRRPDVYVVVEDAIWAREAFLAAGRLRRAGLSVVSELPTARYTVRSLQTQLATASQAGGRGARHVLVFGTHEHRSGRVGLRDLDAQTSQTLPLSEAEAWLVSHATPGAQP